VRFDRVPVKLTSLHFTFTVFNTQNHTVPAHVAITLPIPPRAFTLQPYSPYRTVFLPAHVPLLPASPFTASPCLASPGLHLAIEHWNPATCNVGRATPHHNLTSLTSLATQPQLSGVKGARSLTSQPLSCIHTFRTRPFQVHPRIFPHPLPHLFAHPHCFQSISECAQHVFTGPRRLAITCPSLHQRPFTNRDTPPLILLRDSTKVASPSQDLKHRITARHEERTLRP